MHKIRPSVSILHIGFLAVWGLACVDAASIDITTPGRNGDPRQSQVFDWNGVLVPGQTLEIKGVVGSIHAVPASGVLAEVSAEKRSERSNIADVAIEVVRHAAGVTICAVYPAQQGHAPNECEPGDWGQLSTEKNNDVEVEFTVMVPAGVVFRGNTIVGSIDVDDMTADVFANSITGNVRVQTDAIAEAATITGSVTIYMGQADWGRDIAFSTITGSVFVEIPSNTNADVDISVLNGWIVSDFPLTETSAGRRRGTIGHGGPALELSTITGTVTLRSGS